MSAVHASVSPSSSLLRARVERALADYDTTSGIFYAERMVAEWPACDEARLLLARALIAGGRARQAAEVLAACMTARPGGGGGGGSAGAASSAANERCRFTLAQCLYVLGASTRLFLWFAVAHSFLTRVVRVAFSSPRACHLQIRAAELH